MDDRKKYHVDQDPLGIIRRIRHFALDMDGTMYLDETWIEGALPFLDRITETKRTWSFLTNNSSKSSKEYVDKLHRMGLKVDPQKELITSNEATIDYIKNHFHGKRVFLLGTPVVCEEFTLSGIQLDSRTPEVVVSSFDTSLDYEKLRVFCDFVREGLPYIATHPDLNCPTDTGFMPDIGAIHAFVQASTGRMPDKIIGKPNPEIIDYMLNVGGVSREETAIVGDRLYTDIRSGALNGLHTIFVLSGEGKLKDLPDSDVQPELIFDSVKEIIPFL